MAVINPITPWPPDGKEPIEQLVGDRQLVGLGELGLPYRMQGRNLGVAQRCLSLGHRLGNGRNAFFKVLFIFFIYF